MRFAAVMLMAVAALWALPSGAQQKQKPIQCWTDKSGQRMCGDRIPQEYAGEKRDLIKDGRVIGTVDASKTADEREAEKTRLAKEEQQRKAAEYDRTLLEMYRSQGDIMVMRDERIALLDSRSQAAEKNASDTDKTLSGLRARAEAQQQKEGKVDPALAKQVKQFEKAQQQNTKALDRYRHERETLTAKFDKDYQRYSELRGLPPTPMPPPKPVAAEAGNAAATPATPADPKAGKPAEPATPAKKAG
jgi:recombination DNA repair RAD52 pathway protein